MLRAPHVKIPVQVRPKSEVVETLHEPRGLLPVNPTGNLTTLTGAMLGHIYSQIPAGEIPNFQRSQFLKIL